MKKVLVVGDTILDIYWYGEVNRISPEAPVPVFDFISEKHVLGGACNVAANIRTLFRSNLQIDYFGFHSLEIYNLLAAYKINCVGIPVNDNEILKKTRLICDGHQIARIDHNKRYNYDLRAAAVTKQPNLEYYDLVVVSDYNKGTLEIPEFEKLKYSNVYKIIDLKNLRDGSMPNFITPDGYENKCMFKCNLKEYNENPGIIGLGCDVVVTKGGDGCFFPLVNKHITTNQQLNGGKAIDVIGAGDVFLAGMAVNFLETDLFDIDDMATFGNKCANEKVKHSGTIAVKRGLL